MIRSVSPAGDRRAWRAILGASRRYMVVVPHAGVKARRVASPARLGESYSAAVLIMPASIKSARSGISAGGGGSGARSAMVKRSRRGGHRPRPKRCCRRGDRRRSSVHASRVRSPAAGGTRWLPDGLSAWSHDRVIVRAWQVALMRLGRWSVGEINLVTMACIVVSSFMRAETGASLRAARAAPSWGVLLVVQLRIGGVQGVVGGDAWRCRRRAGHRCRSRAPGVALETVGLKRSLNTSSAAMAVR